MKRIIVAGLFLFLSTGILSAQDAGNWVKSRTWAPKGFPLALHESVDAAQFQTQYEKNREVWDAVFLFLCNTRLDTLSVGERPLPGFDRERCFLRMTEGMTKEAETPQRLEHHKKYIDLQYNRTGSEQIAWASPEGAILITEYDPVRDVAYYTSDRVTHYRSTPDLFFLCFPSDYHMPSLHDGGVQSVKKLVVKIEYIPD